MDTEDSDVSQPPPVLHKLSPRPKARKTKKTTGPPPHLHKQSEARREERGPPCLQRETESDDLPPVLHKETGGAGTKKGAKKTAPAGKVPAKGPGRKKGKAASKTAADQGDTRDFLLPSSHLSPTKRQDSQKTAQKTVPVVSPVKSVSDCYSSPEKGSVSSSQDSDVSGRPDVSVLEQREVDSDDDDDDIAPSQQSAQDLTEKLMQFFKTEPGLYHKVLTYEPLDMAALKCGLKESGIRCSHDKLRKFLDDKCITFTTKNMVPTKRRHRGRKPKSKKTTASQK